MVNLSKDAEELKWNVTSNGHDVFLTLENQVEDIAVETFTISMTAEDAREIANEILAQIGKE